MILVLSDLWLPFPGGAERLMFNIARHLQRSGEQVTVLTGYENAQAFDGPTVQIQPIGVFDTHDYGAKLLAEALEAIRPDVIVTHHLYAFEFEKELTASGIPLVQVVLNTRRIEGAALAVFISSWVRDTVGGFRRGDMVMAPPALPDVVAEEHGDAIGFIKPIPHKGVALVYRIARHLPRYQFVVLRGEWQTLEVIVPLHNVSFMEPVDDIRDFYKHVRLMLVPSLSEDAGTVAQEATLNGLPCISSDAGGLAQTNAGGVRLDPCHLRPWVHAVKAFDDPAYYASVVRSQQEHLAKVDPLGALDELAERIRGLR